MHIKYRSYGSHSWSKLIIKQCISWPANRNFPEFEIVWDLLLGHALISLEHCWTKTKNPNPWHLIVRLKNVKGGAPLKTFEGAPPVKIFTGAGGPTKSIRHRKHNIINIRCFYNKNLFSTFFLSRNKSFFQNNLSFEKGYSGFVHFTCQISEKIR